MTPAPWATTVADWFLELTGSAPEGVWRSPGRVNLIGEHTDYNAGLALPFGIDRHTFVALGRRNDRRLRCWSKQEAHPAFSDIAQLESSRAAGPGRLTDTGRLADGGPLAAAEHLGGPGTPRAPEHAGRTGVTGATNATEATDWARYPLGIFWAFGRRGVDLPGADLVVDSSLPLGSGLSSSAALLAAVAVALDAVCGAGFDLRTLAEICQEAETAFVGAPVGLLDPLAVLHARSAQGMLIDFQSLEIEQLPLDLGPLVVVDSGVRHRHAEGAYAKRRWECGQAAARLGVASLRDASLDAVERNLTGVLRRRARHVVSENQRVAETARRIRLAGAPKTPVVPGAPGVPKTPGVPGAPGGVGGPGKGPVTEVADVGELLYESHCSLRDDFEVSCVELDAVVDAAAALGASGARMTGGGFGGSAIVVGLPAETAARAMEAAFSTRGLPAPRAFATVPSSGATRVY